MSKKAFLLQLYDHSCLYCDKHLTIESCTLEHLLPRSKGGGNELINLAPACSLCNVIRGNEEFSSFVFRTYPLDIRTRIQARVAYAKCIISNKANPDNYKLLLKQLYKKQQLCQTKHYQSPLYFSLTKGTSNGYCKSF